MSGVTGRPGADGGRQREELLAIRVARSSAWRRRTTADAAAAAPAGVAAAEEWSTERTTLGNGSDDIGGTTAAESLPEPERLRLGDGVPAKGGGRVEGRQAVEPCLEGGKAVGEVGREDGAWTRD